ncbi:MAG: AtpZ/AtpI family protein [Hyphomicrobiaceae bacterium]|nr:AtpZ/AtpI family protein [Hyphomicrobiaceae bacterium]
MTMPDKDDPLAKTVRRREQRKKRELREGEASVAQSLAQIGVLGGMVVVPTLIGTFVGRWLDHMFQSHILFTASLLLGGAVLGGWSAWRWMNGQ